MKLFRQIFTGRLLCAFMALHLLNISIDTPETFAYGKSEDLTYNKQESIVEYLVEKVFLQDNVIGEYDECDTDDSLAKKTVLSIDFYVLPDAIAFTPSFVGDVQKDTFHTVTSASNILTEIHSPPPEA
jgi:hypothetical protein